MAERIEVDAIIKAISRGFDQVGQDFEKLARESKKAEDSVKKAGDEAEDTSASLDKLSSISRESALRLAALDARASALNGQMRKLAREVEQGNLDVDKATDTYNDLQRELDKTHDAMRDVEREARKLDDSIEDVGDSSDSAKINIIALNQGVELLKNALGTTIDVARAVFDELERAEQLQALRNTFDNLAGSLGNTDQLLQQLKDSTNGAVSETVLLEGANKALNLGLATTDQELVTLISNAAALGANLGDVSGTVDNVLAAISNESRLRLDNFGVAAARVDELQDQLRAAGEEGTFAQAVMIALQETVDRTGASANLAADDMGRLQTALEDARNEAILELVEALGDDLPNAVDGAVAKIEELNSVISSEEIRDFIDAIIIMKEVSETISVVTVPGFIDKMKEQRKEFEENGRDIRRLVPFYSELNDFSQELGISFREWALGINNATVAQAQNLGVTKGQVDEIEALGDAVSEQNEEWRDAVEQQQLAASRQQGLNRAMEQGVGVVGDTRDGWETYNEQVEENTDSVEENTAALRRSEVQFANNRDRLIELKAEAERLEQQFADLTTELLNAALAGDEYDQTTIDNATSTGTLAGIMRDSAAAAGLDAEGRALLAVATGELSMAQAEAVLRAAAMQAKARELGEQIAAGNITIHEAVAALADLQSSFDGMSTLEARAQIDELEARLNALNGSEVRVTVRVDEVQGTVVQRGGQGAGLSEFQSGGFTGNVATDQVAGVVHGQEFVLNAAATRRLGVGNLNALNMGGSLPGSGVTIENMQIILANPVGATGDQIGTSVANKIGQRIGGGRR